MNIFKTIAKYTLYPLILLSCSYSYADKVWLKNGDIISGNVLLIDDNVLIITTKYANEIRINIANIKTFSTEKPSIVRNDLYSNKQYIKEIHPSEEAGAILIQNQDGEEQTVAITNNLILLKEKDSKAIFNEFTTNGSIKGGFFYDKGTKKTEQYMLDTNISIKHELWRHNVNTTLRRSLKNDSVSTYYYTLQYSLDKFITPKFFWQSTIQYRHDWIEEIRSKKSFGSGPGYQLWDNELSSFSLSLLANYQEMHYRDNNHSRHPLGRLRWDYQRFFNGKTIRLFTNGSVGRSIDNTVQLDLSATIGASYKMTNWLILSSTLTKDRDQTSDGDTKNTTYNLGVGVIW